MVADHFCRHYNRRSIQRVIRLFPVLALLLWVVPANTLVVQAASQTQQIAILRATEPQNTHFGATLALDGDTLVISEPVATFNSRVYLDLS